MANPSAYTIPISPFGSDASENNLVHQSSPAWVLTFVRWNIRDPMRTPTSAPQEIRDPLVVENDCIEVNVSSNKGTLTPNFSAVLKVTDVNYSTAVHPGDFCFVNMLNWETEGQKVTGSRDVARAAAGLKPINEYSYGFKGFFKVQSVRKSLQTDPGTGTKTLIVRIDGFGFTEFNNTIYFNPNLINEKALQNFGLYISDIAAGWANWVTQITNKPIQNTLAFLIHNLIGNSRNPSATTVDGLVRSPNDHFLIPQGVGRLMGVVNDDQFDSSKWRTQTVGVKDVYSYMFGLQKYSGSAQGTDAASASKGLNPSNLKATQEYGNFYYTSIPCAGKSVLKAEYWNQVKLWSILNQYTNAPLNELYTCFKVNPNGRVMPFVVFRQIPFTSDDFAKRKVQKSTDSSAANIQTTRFLTLPRWKIDPAMVLSFDLGVDEAARVNFVQYYAKSTISDKGIDIAQETALGNYVYDKDDISRSGLRPYIVQNQFADLTESVVHEAPVWARILGDAVIGGHLKHNGTLVCIGIVDPIAVGENLEFDGVVYHIEQVTHTCSINPSTGTKSFRTILSVSHGVSVQSDEKGNLYPDMANSSAYDQRVDDWNNNQILPGTSESQDIISRADSGSIDISALPTNSPFPQPSLTNNKPRTGE